MRQALALVGLVLVGCASPPPLAPPPPGPPAASPPLEPAPAPALPDACGASDHQRLVGRPRTEVPVPIRPELQRVACDNCPVTQDFNPNRLNFFFDAASGRITKVSCG